MPRRPSKAPLRTLGATALKLLGLALFIFLVVELDYSRVLRIVQSGEPLTLLFSFVLLLAAFGLKAFRFRRMARIEDVDLPYRRAWELFMLGSFLGTLTPTKVGELGRTAHLAREGMEVRTALTVSLVDRGVDAVALVPLTLASVGLLFGAGTLALAVAAALAAALPAAWLWRRLQRSDLRVQWLRLLRHVTRPRELLFSGGVTLAAWVFHVAWVVTLAAAISISLPVRVFAPVVVLVSVISLLPVAPAGLGTRDAALLFFLAPYDVPAERTAALALLMLLSLLATSAIGLWYWLTEGPGGRGRTPAGAPE